MLPNARHAGVLTDAGPEQESIVEGTIAAFLVSAHVAVPNVRRPAHLVDEWVRAIADELQSRQRHLDQLPFHVPDEPLEFPRRLRCRLPERERQIPPVHRSERLNTLDDLGLAAAIC